MTGKVSREEVFLTAKQVAARYGMSRQWPYHCPEMMALSRRIGKRVLRWALSDLEEFEKREDKRGEDFRYYLKQVQFLREKNVKFLIKNKA